MCSPLGEKCPTPGQRNSGEGHADVGEGEKEGGRHGEGETLTAGGDGHTDGQDHPGDVHRAQADGGPVLRLVPFGHMGDVPCCPRLPGASRDQAVEEVSCGCGHHCGEGTGYPVGHGGGGHSLPLGWLTVLSETPGGRAGVCGVEEVP